MTYTKCLKRNVHICISGFEMSASRKVFAQVRNKWSQMRNVNNVKIGNIEFTKKTKTHNDELNGNKS